MYFQFRTDKSFTQTILRPSCQSRKEQTPYSSSRLVDTGKKPVEPVPQHHKNEQHRPLTTRGK